MGITKCPKLTKFKTKKYNKIDEQEMPHQANLFRFKLFKQ